MPPSAIGHSLRQGSLGSDLDLARVVTFLAGSPLDPSTLPWEQLRRQDLQVIREWATEAFLPTSAKRILGAVRKALRVAASVDGEAVATARICRIRSGSPMVTGRRLTSRQASLLLEVCEMDDTPRGKRDATIIALMILGGLKRNDVASLSISDYEDESNALRLRGRISHRATRMLVLQEDCASLFEAWLAARGTAAGPLFPAVDRLGNTRDGIGIGPTAVNHMLIRRGREAALAYLTPGDLRVVFLTRLRDQARQDGFVGQSRFGFGIDGEASLVLTTLRTIPSGGYGRLRPAG